MLLFMDQTRPPTIASGPNRSDTPCCGFRLFCEVSLEAFEGYTVLTNTTTLESEFRSLGMHRRMAWEHFSPSMDVYVNHVSTDNEDALGIKTGGCEAQQLLECLCGLTAIRQWAQRWKRSAGNEVPPRWQHVIPGAVLDAQDAVETLGSGGQGVCIGSGYCKFSTGGSATPAWDSQCRGRLTLHLQKVWARKALRSPPKFDTITKAVVLVEDVDRALHAGTTTGRHRGMEQEEMPQKWSINELESARHWTAADACSERRGFLACHFPSFQAR